jgi:hypothetical protein
MSRCVWKVAQKLQPALLPSEAPLMLLKYASNAAPSDAPSDALSTV